MRWSIHHVNICSPNVSRTRWFLNELLGLPLGTWSYPPAEQMGEVGHDDDHIAYFGTGNAASIHGCFLGPTGRIYLCDGRHGHEFRDVPSPSLAALFPHEQTF